MKKIYFHLLYWQHKCLQIVGLKSKADKVVKIWYDHEKQETYLYAAVRSGLFYLPIAHKCDGGKEVFSYWLVDIEMQFEYGLFDEAKNKTIYRLTKVDEKYDKKADANHPQQTPQVPT